MNQQILKIDKKICEGKNCQNEPVTIITLQGTFHRMKLQICYPCQDKIMHLIHEAWTILGH